MLDGLNHTTTTMVKFVVFVAALCISSALGAPSDNERIVGGQAARPGQFPHQISMQANGQHFCGGSIINPTKILTAAHCIYGNNGAMDVVAGIDNLTQRGQRVRVARAYYHANYDPRLLVNDVAVLILSQPLSYNQFVQPITLANANPAPGTILTLSGWGYLSYPPTGTPNQLQTINLTNMDLQQCSRALQGYSPITNGHVCTTSAKGFGACQGDSGGPLIAGNVQVGVVSWGVPCANGLPDVFTSVAAYRGFIDGTN